MVPSACASLTALVRRRANPLDYRVSGPVAADSPPGPVDVIVPVYGAADDLRRCLASLRRDTAAAHRLLLVIDGPQPAAVEEVLREKRWPVPRARRPWCATPSDEASSRA